MKKLTLLAAIALPMAFASCENEDFINAPVDNNTEATGVAVTGARIAGHGMTVTPQGANTRFDANGNWVSGEKLGVAWVTTRADFNDISKNLNLLEVVGFDINDEIGSTEALTAEQKKSYAKLTKYVGTTNKESATFTFQDAKLYNGKTSTKTLSKTDATPFNGKQGNYYRIIWRENSYTDEETGYQYYPTPVAGISQPQLDGFDANNASNFWASVAEVSDYKLYANNMFTYNGQAFHYDGDIYEGAYFAYWPFKKIYGVKNMEVELSNTQDSKDDLLYFNNNALEISPIQAVQAPRDEKTGEYLENAPLNIAFSLKKVANGIGFNTKFVGKGDVEGLKIGAVEVATNDKGVFYTTAELQPQKLPNVNDEDAVMDAATLIGADKAIKLGDAASALAVNAGVDMDVNGANYLVALTFPTKKGGNVAESDITITVPAYTLDSKNKPVSDGKFVISKKEGAELSEAQIANNNAIVKLAALLSDKGWYNDKNSQYLSSTEILKNPVYMNLSLNMADYVKELYKVSNAKEWNEAVANINALGINNANIEISGAIKFDATNKPTFPTAATLVVSTKDDKPYVMTIFGTDAAIAKDITFSDVIPVTIPTGTALTVKEGAKLTLRDATATLTEGITNGIEVDGVLNVNGTITSDAATTANYATIDIHTHGTEIKGVMNVGAKGVVEKVKLNNGNVINITEGAKNSIVTPETGKVGKIYATLTSAATKDVITNILVTPATNVTFDGAKVEAGKLKVGVTYNTKGATSFKTISEFAAAIEITDGTLTFVKDASAKLGDITIKADAALVDNSENASVEVGTITNDGTVKVGANTTLTTETVKGGKVEIATSGKLIKKSGN